MISVRQDDARVEIVYQVALRDAFDGGLRADRHEDRRLDGAVGGVHQARARASIGTDGLQLEAHLSNVSVRGVWPNRIKWEERLF